MILLNLLSQFTLCLILNVHYRPSYYYTQRYNFGLSSWHSLQSCKLKMFINDAYAFKVYTVCDMDILSTVKVVTLKKMHFISLHSDQNHIYIYIYIFIYIYLYIYIYIYLYKFIYIYIYIYYIYIYIHIYIYIYRLQIVNETNCQ